MRRLTRRRAAGAKGRPVASAVGAFLLVAGLLVPVAGGAAPITGDPSAGPGRPGVGSTLSCGIETNGTTTCAVSHGLASVCPSRVPGADLERSYRRYDYSLIEGGCTLSADYWRTHSRGGAAPFDDTWDRLGEGGGTQFFNAAETYHQILAAGAGDGPYYRLARAYAAAELNSINGAPFPEEVGRSFEEATVSFLGADPERLEADAVLRFETLAAVLEDYNAGVTGPGSCPPLSEPFSSADVGKTLQGVESRDAGTVVAVDERYGRGGGLVTIRPQSEADQFVMPDEAFTVAGVRKAKFTTVVADCVEVATGQQTTVEVGGLPSAPQLASAAFLSRERMMRVLVAVNDAAAAGELAPAAGPSAPAASTALALPAGATSSGGGGAAGAFPSATLPSVGGGGVGAGFIIVPDVVGRTLSEARIILQGAGLSVGPVRMMQRDSMLHGIIGVAFAQEEPIVVEQDPPAGTVVPADDPPSIELEAEAPPAAIPEPASLLLFATGLALILIVLVRRRAG